MKLLLDTHILIWSQIDEARLSARVRGSLADPANERWLSPVSVWEIALLARKGRMEFDQSVPDWLATACQAAPWREAPLTSAVVLAADGLRMHADPADRFLAATAQVYGLTLVTADRRLLGVEGFERLAN